MSRSSLDREVGNRLRSSGVRYTRGRRTVMSTLAVSEGPLSASELYDVMGGGLPLSSIYRSLAVLLDAGVLAAHHGSKGLTRFEPAEWLRGHHHHFVCVDCGSVEDVEVTDRNESEVDRLVNEASAKASFTPIGHVLEIEGRCAKCA